LLKNRDNELNRSESGFLKRKTINSCPVLTLQQINQNHSTLTFLREKSSESDATTEKKISTSSSVTNQTKKPITSSASREAKTEQNIRQSQHQSQS
jgi:hypothetical protein